MKKNRMERRIGSEWQFLDGCYLFTLICYMMIEFIYKQKIEDGIFIGLLTSATLFLNYRQRRLYYSLKIDERGNKFFASLYNKDEQNKQIDDIFLSKMNDVFALLFAFIFSIVVYHLEIQESIIIVKFSFAIYIFMANLPTGLAIVRLAKYFKYTFIWINKLNIIEKKSCVFEEDYLKRIRNDVLFTAVLYCTLSLSSILFIRFNINFIVILYTIFAVVLVVFAMIITDALLAKKKRTEQNYSNYMMRLI